MLFKANEGTPVPIGMLNSATVLRRVSVYFRTVRYEVNYGDGVVFCGPAFPATLQEWERARD